MEIRFCNSEHEQRFQFVCNKMKSLDEYHLPVAYLIALDKIVYSHQNDVFDFVEDVIMLEGIYQAWQTGTTRNTTRLLYNLWNGHVDDNPCNSSVSEIFCCSYAPYYYEAVKLRYPDYA